MLNLSSLQKENADKNLWLVNRNAIPLLTLGGLYAGYKRNEVKLDFFLSNGKNLQRDFVWSLQLQQAFVIAVIQGKYTPTLAYLIRYDANEQFVYHVLDGKQRLNSLFGFMNNQFAIPTDQGDMYYSELPVEIQDKMRCSSECTKGQSYTWNTPTGLPPDNEVIKLFETFNWHETDDSSIAHLKQLRRI